MGESVPKKHRSVGCMDCMKYILILFNSLFVVFGCVLLFLGVWFYTTPANKNIAGISLTEDEIKQLNTMTLSVIAVGAAIVIYSIVACCGVLDSNRYLMMFSILLTCAFLVVQIVICAFGFIFRVQISKNIENEMARSLAIDYKGDNATDMASVSWNNMQQYVRNASLLAFSFLILISLYPIMALKFSCCGVNYAGYLNYTLLTYRSTNGSNQTPVTGPTSWYLSRPSAQSWPNSCCSDVNNPTSFNATSCVAVDGRTASTYRNDIGCVTYMFNFFSRHLILLGILAAAIAIIEITSILLYWQVYKHSKSNVRKILL